MGIWHRSHLRQTHLDFHFWQKTVFQLNIYDQSQREVISFRTFLMSHILRQQGSRDSSRQCVISVSRCHDHTKSRSQYIYLKTEDVIGYDRLTSMKSCIKLSLQQIPANKITAVFLFCVFLEMWWNKGDLLHFETLLDCGRAANAQLFISTCGDSGNFTTASAFLW